jgi:hypothetical protein
MRDDNPDARIIEAEISRLEAAYRDAQERYAYTGSPSTDRTMHKYQVLQTALEEYLTRNSDKSKQRMIETQQGQLYRIKQAVERMRGKDISFDAAAELMMILMGR